MNTNFNSPMRRCATTTASAGRVVTLACAALLISAVGLSSDAFAQNKVTKAAIELQEVKTALAISQKQLATERVRSAALDETRKALAESLAAANGQAKAQRTAYQDLLIKMEALGVDVLNVEPQGLQQRLLKAVRATALQREENQKLAQQLMTLSEAVVGYLQNDKAAEVAPQARMLVESELQASDVTLGLRLPKAKKAPVNVSQAKVVSMDPEIGLIILNVGRKGGVRVGMPLEILRSDRPIGTALVVDVRDSICGAVLNELVSNSDDVKIGDRIQPKPQQL
ncbi:MAG: hypothetical protein L3J39_04330 [Verrucomicrobiales bacterium]|nr:hypothetical protein [Verrucomicrobiales bacterium]